MFTGFWKNASKSPFAKGFAKGVREPFGIVYHKGVSKGFLGRLGEGGIRKNWLGGALGLAGTAFTFYQGYQEGGMWGGIKNTAVQTAQWAAIEGGISTIGSLAANPIAMGLTAAAAVGYSYYKLGEAGIAKAKRFRNLEMGADIVDTFGTMATMRQRSLSAIQNSHVNGRLALGGEAAMMHTPYMR